MRWSQKRAVEPFLTGEVLQQFLLVLKTLGREKQYNICSFLLTSSLISLCTVPFFSLCSPPQGRFGTSALRGLLAVSLTLNAVFTSAYVYRSLR